MLRGYLTDIFADLSTFGGDAVRHRVTALAGAMAIASATLVAPSHAFDTKENLSEESTGKTWMTFKFGFSAYKDGRKDEAFKAYSDAAKEGHIGARWKLAQMYAAGEGVDEDDYEAFKLLRGIVNDGAAFGSRDSSYVAHALVSIGRYLRSGIDGSPVKANPTRARDIYWQAAANFGDANAQFELGKMFLDGVGGSVDRRQAARWFNLSARKGHPGAHAMLGKMMFDAGKVVEGIGLMTVALQTADESDHGWIRNMQEEAFALSSEAERRTGISYGEGLLKQ